MENNDPRTKGPGRSYDDAPVDDGRRDEAGAKGGGKSTAVTWVVIAIVAGVLCYAFASSI